MPYFFRSTTCLILFLTFFASCQTPQNAERPKFYYDLQGFIETQMVILDEIRPEVDKEVMMNGEKEQKMLKIGNWQKELAMFLQADLNKPYLKDMYEEKDSISNQQKFKVYTAKQSNLSVKYLILELSDNEVKSLEAFIFNENYLYTSEKKFNFSCSADKGKWTISQYRIEGKQKMIFTSEETYTLLGKIQF